MITNSLPLVDGFIDAVFIVVIVIISCTKKEKTIGSMISIGRRLKISCIERSSIVTQDGMTIIIVDAVIFILASFMAVMIRMLHHFCVTV